MRDMTEGRIVRPLLIFALPILAGIVLQRLYNLFDTMLVGRFIDKSALAAVGSCGSVFGIILSTCHGFVSGFQIVISQYFGAKDSEKLKKSIAGTYLLAIIIAVLLSVFALLFIEPILHLIKVPEEIFTQAKQYLSILSAGIVFTVCYNMFSGILRALGDSLLPLIFLFISVILNGILDIVFIVILKQGVAGAASATVIAQAVSAILCFIFSIKKRPVMKVRLSDFKIPPFILKQLLSQGFAMFMMFTVVDIGSVILQAGINSLGEDLIAGFTAGRKYLELLMLPGGAFASSAATFVSQNYGAKKYSRITKGIKYLVLISWIWAATTILISSLFGYELVTSITGKDVDQIIINSSLKYLRIGVPFFFTLFMLVIIRSSLQGIDHKKLPVVASIIELAVKVLSTFWLIPMMGFTAICFAEPITWVLGTLWVTPPFIISLRKLIAEEAAATE